MAGNGDGSITIPRWALWLLGGFSAVFLGLFIPWAAWLSATTIRIQVAVEAQPANYADLKVKVDNSASQVAGIIGRVRVLETKVRDMSKPRWWQFKSEEKKKTSWLHGREPVLGLAVGYGALDLAFDHHRVTSGRPANRGRVEVSGRP